MDAASQPTLPADIEDGFSGVITAHVHGEQVAGWACGLADRTFAVPNSLDTRFGLASVTKTFTAATMLSLVAEGKLSLDTTARSVLGDDLPLIAEDVTIDHLLTHTSGIGDYLDEERGDPGSMSIPVQQLDCAEAYVPVLDGYETKFPAGERFSYSNGGYVVLGIIAERISGVPYGQLVSSRVFDAAGMVSADFARSDGLRPKTATGYRGDGTTNVFHLPVVGVGDGGAHAAALDLARYWRALFGGILLPREYVELMTASVTPSGADAFGCGRGIWIPGAFDGGAFDGWFALNGGDHGVAAFSLFHPGTRVTLTLLANEEVTTFRRLAVVRTMLEKTGAIPRS